MRNTKFDAIIVLGAGITKKGNLSKVAKSRVDKGIELYRNGAAPRIIVTGKKESAVMKLYAVKKGVTKEDVLVESRSLDTVSNAFFSRKKFLLPNRWHRLIVVTSVFHLPRTKFVFRKILGKSHVIKFVASRRVLSKSMFEKKLKLEHGLFMLTKILSILVADGDMKAIENFIKKNPLYGLYNRISSDNA